MIPMIVYSNTDYLDVLEIFVHYAKEVQKKKLLIDNRSLENSQMFSHFDKIIFYEEAMAYSDRLFHCISQLEEEYFLLTHDHDILLSYDEKSLDGIVSLMKTNGWDKCGLHPLLNCFNIEPNNKEIYAMKEGGDSSWVACCFEELKYPCCFIVPHNKSNTYQYNVNPTIWKRDSLLQLLSKHRGTGYRDIEEKLASDISKMNIRVLCSMPRLNCGYHSSTPMYKYIHITKYNKFLPLNSSKLTQYGDSYSDVAEEYFKIVEKFGLKNGKRPIFC